MEMTFLKWSVLLYVLSSVELTASSSCEVDINDCRYNLVLLPSQQCSSDKVSLSRSPRSTLSPHNDTTIVENISSLTNSVNKVQSKLTREMRNLSKRLLRGMRRIESALDIKSSGHKKRGMGSKGRCPSGFVTLEGWPNCYLFSLFNTSWYEARDYCNAFDSDLVSLGSIKEHYVVTFLIKNNPVYKDMEGWWTSGSFAAKTKQWLWISSVINEPFSVYKWAVNEPNKSSLQCVLLYGKDDHLWHDRLCSDRYNFVCEIALN